MLKLSVHHYLKSIGDKIFVPNPDYPEWLNVDCLDVAIKRKPKWFWQKNVYTYDHFGLNDLLDSPLPTDKSQLLRPAEPMTPNFEWSIKHSIKGKLGGKIASLLSLDISGDDTISVSIKMEGMMKQSINYSAVAEVLRTKKINLNSKYVRHVSRHKRNVICIVSQYIYLSKPTDIKFCLNWDIDQDSDATKAKININDSENFHSEKVRTITFEAGTRLAFDFAECLIRSDGSIELLDRSEGFTKDIMIPDIHNYPGDFVDTGDTSDTGNRKEINNNLDDILKEVQNQDISKSLLVLSIADKNHFKQLESFLVECLDHVSGQQDSLDLPTFNVDDSNISYLLQQTGLNIKTKDTAVKVSKLNVEIINEVLLKIQSIYHLETPHQKNLLEIMQECETSTLKDLLSCLQSMRQSSDSNRELYEKLIVNKKIKLLFLSVGVIDDQVDLNEYFEPTMILLHGY